MSQFILHITERIPAMIEFFSGLARLLGELGRSRRRLEHRVYQDRRPPVKGLHRLFQVL